MRVDVPRHWIITYNKSRRYPSLPGIGILFFANAVQPNECHPPDPGNLFVTNAFGDINPDLNSTVWLILTCSGYFPCASDHVGVAW